MKKLNQTNSIEIRADLSITKEQLDDETISNVTYGLKDPLLIIDQQYSEALSVDPNKFLVSADTFETAKSEFWFRFRLYLRNRFNRHHIPITIIQTHVQHT